ncbi:MAG: GNAT family N-acetyltransferase [Azospirillaceae bacterium]
MTEIAYRPLRESEMAGHIALLMFTFGSPDAYQAGWRRAVGDANHRGLFAGDDLRAALSWIPSAHHLHGRPVPAGCLTGVAVAAEVRGAGVGRRLIAEGIREAATNRWGLVSLFASSPAFYRRNGFANAGHFTVYKADTLPLDAVPKAEGWRVEALEIPEDASALADLHARCEAIRARWQAQGQGLLERVPFLRWRQWNRNEGHRRLFFLTGPDGEAAYAVLTRSRNTLMLVDHCAPGPGGPAAVLSLLAGHRTMAKEVAWCGAPVDPLVEALPDAQWRVHELEPFMSRVTDLKVALTARGYPEGAHGSLVLRYDDPLLTDQSGSYRLVVADGKATLERLGDRDAIAGDGAVTLDLPVAAAAPLLTGHLGAGRLAAMGRLSGPPAAIAMAERLFAGPAPWVEEFF